MGYRAGAASLSADAVAANADTGLGNAGTGLANADIALANAGIGLENAGQGADLDAVIDEVAGKMLAGITPRYITRELAIAISKNTVTFTDPDGTEVMRVESADLAANLSGCGLALLYAATLGESADRLVHRYELLSMLKASAAQAAGAEIIESFCDSAVKEIGKQMQPRGLYLKPRFSPGYGDFALEHQRDFFRVLDLERKLGLHLNGSLLMVPTKSVTAVIGLTANPEACHISKCAKCDKTDCEFRMVHDDE